MTTGYLWDGQFQELKKVLNEGQPQSMELDSNSLDGHWAKDNNLGVEFFIINDAVFSKLCILGDDVEPCFEGSSVTATSSEVEKTFTVKNKDFSTTLFTMMNELTDALQSKGGLNMLNEFAKQTETAEVNKSTEFTEETSTEVAEESVDYTNAEEAPATEEAEDFAKKDDDKDDSDDAKDESDSEEDDDEDEKKKKPASEHTLEEYEALASEIESLRAEVESLREFKLTVENEQKDALMDSFPYNTLSAEDKAEVIEHKSEFSLEEIEAKLAVIYVKKGVHFAAAETEESEKEADQDAITTFSLDGEVVGPMSGLQEALHKTMKD